MADGTRIGFVFNGKVEYGVKSRDDEGGWIYPSWAEPKTGMPGWLQPTQVFIVQKEGP